MKDACGLCSTYQLANSVFVDEQTVEKKAAAYFKNNIIDHGTSEQQQQQEVESIVSSTKLESICEEAREGAAEPSSQQKKLTINTMSVQEITVVHGSSNSNNNNQQVERDFDKNPTELYLALSHKDWNAANARCQSHPEECRIWIYRHESDGQTLRWKLLPIHAAIIFSAPLETVDALLHAFRDGVAAQDDQGMVPLHLAIRMGSSEAIVAKLATEITINAMDRKGRTPRNLAERQEPHKKDLYLRAMMTPTFRAAVSPLSPTTTTAAGNNYYSPPTTPKNTPATTMEDLKQAHIREVEKLKREAAAKSIQLTAKVDVLENELKKIPLLEAAIVDLEGKLKKQQEHESELQEKLEEMQTATEDLTKEKEKMDDANKAVISNLVSQVGDLQKKLTAATTAKEEISAEKAQVEELSKGDRSKLIKEISELQIKLGDTAAHLDETTKELEKAEVLNETNKARLEQMDTEIAKLRKDLKTSEAKLEEVTISEQELAWQNSSLAEKLATGCTDYRVKALEKEREELRTTVNKLSVKLYKVVGFLDEMVQEQEAIITASVTRESQDETATDAGSRGGGGEKLRSNVTGMKEQIITVIDSVIDGLPKSDEQQQQQQQEQEQLEQQIFQDMQEAADEEGYHEEEEKKEEALEVEVEVEEETFLVKEEEEEIFPIKEETPVEDLA